MALIAEQTKLKKVLGNLVKQLHEISNLINKSYFMEIINMYKSNKQAMIAQAQTLGRYHVETQPSSPK